MLPSVLFAHTTITPVTLFIHPKVANNSKNTIMENNNRKREKKCQQLLYIAHLNLEASVIKFTVHISKFFSSFLQHDALQFKTEIALALA